MKLAEILAYTAGIVDGEGCISITKNYRTIKSVRLYVSVANTNEFLCQWLKMQFGGKVSSWNPAKPHWKRPYRWQLVSRAAGKFLEQILPYLNIKRPQAELGIRFQKRRVNYRRAIPLEHLALDQSDSRTMGQLNKKGVGI